MPLCASCGLPVPGAEELCRHHTAALDDWSEANRAFCDFLHRRLVRAATTAPDRSTTPPAAGEAPCEPDRPARRQ